MNGVAIQRRALVMLALSAGAARAEPEPHLDIAALPPLPVIDDAAPSSSASVAAAADAEEDVVVAAAKREQSLGSVASAVTVISGDRVRRFGYRTVGEAIAGVAGAYLVDNRLSYSIGIRGLQLPGDFNTRWLVLVDGAAVNEGWGAFAGLGFDALVAIDEVARIEVIRGPVSSIYGTNAFFGTINIVTRGAAESPRGWASAGVNSVNGATASAGFAVGEVHRQLRGSVHVMERFGDTTRVAQLPGPLAGDGASALAAALAGAYDGSFGQVRVVRYRRESPFAPYDSDPAGAPYAQRNTQLVVEGGHTHSLSARWTVAGRLFGNAYKFDDRAVPVQGAALVTEGVAETVGVELRTRYELVPHLLGLSAGAELSDNRTFSRAFLGGARIVDTPYRYAVEGAYAELDAQPAPWLGITAGARADRHDIVDYEPRDATGTPIAYDVVQTNVSPRAAVFVAAPERYGLKLLYAEGFRAPSAFEGAFNDGRDFAANADIAAERMRSYEAVAWAKPTPGLALRLSAFAWRVRHAIQQQPALDGSGQLMFRSDGTYRSRGLEAEASYRDARGWYAFAGASYARVHSNEAFADGAGGRVVPFEDDDAPNAPNAPAWTASAGASSPRLWERVHVSSDVAFIGARTTRLDARGARSPDAPRWLGWNATVYAPRVIAGIDVTVGVRNALGTRDQLPAPGDYDRHTGAQPVVVPRVPGEGRELYLRVGYAY